MVSIGKLAAGQADYYLEQAAGRVDRPASVASGVEDYYLGGPEAAGEWLGAGIATLQLDGDVDADELRAVLSGRSPETGGLLPRRPLRVPGFDVTFSAPKSVSVLFGLGEARVRDSTRAAHDAAVRAAFGYLERQAAFSRRGHDGHEVVAGDGLVAAAFRHRTSRAGDPQLHTHVLVANLAQAADGRWRALDGRRLYAHARTAGFIYEFRLRAELSRRLGVEWETPQNGIADVTGIPRPVLHAFSRRRSEIVAELERTGRDSAAAAQVAALNTRRRKHYDVTPEKLRTEWLQRAARLGLDPHSIESRVLGERVGARLPTDVEEQRIARDLASAEGLTRDRTSITRRDAIRAWCEELPLGSDLSVEELEERADAMLASDAFVPLIEAGSPSGDVIRRRDGRLVVARDGDRRYSTRELLALEQRIIALAIAPASAPVADPQAVERSLKRRSALAWEQASMVSRLAMDPARVTLVVGKAGAGKTFALDAARGAWEDSGIQVLGAAVARRAARELEEGAGIMSTSVAGLLTDLRRGGPFGLPRRSIVVIDEASLLATRQLAELLDEVVRADGKLVLVGDHRQLPAIQAGGAFRGLMMRVGAIEVTENRRQREEWERAALDLLREGHGADSLRFYASRDRLVVGEDARTVRAALVEDWWRSVDSGDGVMIAFRRADVRDLNARARALLSEAGRLGPTNLSLESGEYAAGDRVVLRRNDRRLGVANGDRGSVVDVDPSRGRLLVAIGQRRVALDAGYLAASARRPALTHGYAVTGHIAQGMTVDRAFVLGTDTLFQEWGYVALSRGRELNRFYAVAGGPIDRDEYAPAGEKGEPLDDVARALERSQAELLASDTASAAGLHAASTQSLREEALRLRAAGADHGRAARRSLERIRVALGEDRSTREGRRGLLPSDAQGDVEHHLSAARHAALRDEEVRLTAMLGEADHSAAAKLALVEEELHRRDRLSAGAAVLEPSSAALDAIGPRPDRPSELRLWRRRAARFERARDAARELYRRVIG